MDLFSNEEATLRTTPSNEIGMKADQPLECHVLERYIALPSGS